MSYAYWDSSFLVLMTKCKFGGGGNGKVTDVRTRKMFLMNKSPISSSRFSSTSPYPCKIVCSRGLFMLMLMCVTERMTHTQKGTIDSSGLHGPYMAGPSPPVSGYQASRKDSCLWECCANLATSTAKWNSRFPTHMANDGIHLLPTKPADKAPLPSTARKSPTYPKDWVSTTSRQHRCLQ